MAMCEEWGEGGELYANMRSAARQEDIYLSANHYGEIPPDPYAETKEENQLLKLQNKQLKEQITTMKKECTHIGYNVENMTINMSGGTLVQHADLVQASGEVIVEKPSEVTNQPSGCKRFRLLSPNRSVQKRWKNGDSRSRITQRSQRICIQVDSNYQYKRGPRLFRYQEYEFASIIQCLK